MIVTTYVCNNCLKREEGIDGKPPLNWRVIRWRPGVIAPPNGTPTRPDKHACSPQCLAAISTSKGQHDAS